MESKTVGVSDFVRRQTPESRFSHFVGSWNHLRNFAVALLRDPWRLGCHVHRGAIRAGHHLLVHADLSGVAMSEAQITRLIDSVMARRSGGSGTAVFVDPIILRSLIEAALKEAS